MVLKKRTFALPLQTLRSFERQVPAKQRNSIVAGLLEGWLDERERARLRREIAAGCKEMASVYLETENEYHPLEEEVHRALDFQPQSRRRGARKARSRRRV